MKVGKLQMFRRIFFTCVFSFISCSLLDCTVVVVALVMRADTMDDSLGCPGGKSEIFVRERNTFGCSVTKQAVCKICEDGRKRAAKSASSEHPRSFHASFVICLGTIYYKTKCFLLLTNNIFK